MVMSIGIDSLDKDKGLLKVKMKENETKVHTCKKRGIAGIYPRKFFWIFRKILG